MASHPYPHQGPGPSSYYQQSPPPHHVYGPHSPGPRPNYYAYQGAPLPHMNSHQPGQYHQPGPSRGNHRGGNLGGGYSSRGNHGYQSYQQPHLQPHYAHSHINPPLGGHPHSQHAGQHIAYSPQSVKYNQPYSPTYSYPSPTAPIFTPSWQTQQTLSPLPKQLSMPLPQNITQTFYEPPAAPPLTQVTPKPPSPLKTPIEPSTEGIEITTEETAQTDPPAPTVSPSHVTSSLPAASSLEPDDTPLPGPHASSSYSQMGTIQTSETVSSLSLSSASLPPSDAFANASAKWAIWSRRPQDPSHAPSIIISPRARPPPVVVQQALDLKTPPPSAPTSPALSNKHVPLVDEEPVVVEDVPASASPVRPDSEESASSWISNTNSTAPSSSVTETTDTPTVPASPASSHTSLSVSGTHGQDGKAVSTPLAEADKIFEPAKPVSAPTTESAPAALPVPIVETTPSAVSVSTSTSTTEEPAESSSKATTPVPEMLANPLPPTIPVAPAPAPAKKSWASLLRPAGTSAASPPVGVARNALPTSSVVGFSIPATSGPLLPVLPSRKSELITLLTTGPSQASGFAAAAAGATSASSMSKIRPRGLVNSGNMCFANSVLQVLVYCPPFHRLFVELGKVLVSPGAGNGNANGNAVAGNSSGVNGTEKAESTTPLVDATVHFLNEFIEDKKSKSKSRLEVVNRGVNGGGAGASGRGKGKEREAREEQDAEDDWDGDSFLPSYVYDAMKAKKRFDSMRGGHQEDAEEFFGFYLVTLEEELLSLLNAVNPPKAAKKPAAVEEREEAAPPEDDGWLEVGKRNRTVVTRTIKATESPITQIFGGKIRRTTRISGQKDSVDVEDCRSLMLDIGRENIHTVQDALSYISHPQTVQVNSTTGQQQVLIEALPPILVLHMKRFDFDAATGTPIKVVKQVRFGPELEIGADMMVPAAKKPQPARYKLFAALYHHGQSASGGHYTLDILHPNRYPSSNAAKPREGWIRIDDDLVSDVRPEDVFDAHEREDSRCAYLLFYRRI